MSDNIINLGDHLPHQTSYVACLKCAKDWIAVAPVITAHFECPDCLKLSGLVVDPQCPHFFNAFMRPAKRKADKQKRTMVLLNAARMIKERLI